ncbi:MAG: malto-oligosyltrehalose synthase [Chloroflexota bacterium]
MVDESVGDRGRGDDGQISDSLAQIAREALGHRRVPGATYRIQLGRSFTFLDARRIVPYLDRLGVTDVYASPCLKAGRESDHGYDIIDHGCLNEALGSPEDFVAFTAELRHRGMGLIFDLVPNHMGIPGDENPWWADVLENGPSSPFAPYFDIDWHPLKAGTDLENRVLLPILGEPYGMALEGQQLTLTFADGAFFVTYHDKKMPVAPRRYAELLSARLQTLTESLGSDDPHVLELQSIITAINYLPLETDTDPEKVAERQREKQIIKQRIERLAMSSPAVWDAIASTVSDYNGVRGEPRSFDDLDTLLNNQSYRLSFWRVAAEEINYRRFFDVNELAAIRMEQPEVFEASHRLVMDLVRRGQVTGLRIDHVDGLWDPEGYLDQVQLAAFRALCQDGLDSRFGTAGPERDQGERDLEQWYIHSRGQAATVGSQPRPLYIVVEKILGRGEGLPWSWPVDGTTGYDFANLVNGVFVDGANRKAFTNLYASFTRGSPTRFADLTNSTKKIIMLVSLASEVNELGYRLKRIATKNRLYRDFTLNSLTHAIREVIAALPVYRTYWNGRAKDVDPHDRAAIEAAVVEAKRRNPRTATSVFDFVRAVLFLQCPDGASEEDRAEFAGFMMRFQQATGPAMAKGVEDTAFYVYNRLLSLNEVGGDPERFGVSPSVFHQQNLARQQDWPGSLSGGSTHDSKRGADVRARLDVLSEIPSMWHRAISRWSRQNRRKRSAVYGQAAPDRNDEYFLYQTLVGVWPLTPMNDTEAGVFRQRILDYVQKAIREAKVHTSWVNPNLQYDEAVATFIDRVLTARSDVGFLPDFHQFQSYVAFYGMLNSLSLTLLQLTAPGIPDLYQGSELWDFSLVDPDNRRPVDYSSRVAALDRIEVAATERNDRLAVLASSLLETWRDGRVKLHVAQRALQARRAYPAVFQNGDYVPLEAVGARRDHVVGFGRALGDDGFITVVPRLVVGLTHGAPTCPLGAMTWGDTAVSLPEGLAGARFRNLLTGEAVNPTARDGVAMLDLAEVLRTFPVALLRRGE